MEASPHRASSKLTVVDAGHAQIGSRLLNALTGRLQDLNSRLETRAKLDTLDTAADFIKQARIWYGLYDALQRRCRESVNGTRAEARLADSQKLRIVHMAGKKEKLAQLAEKIGLALLQGKKVLYLASEKQPRDELLLAVRKRSGCPEDFTILYKDRQNDIARRLIAIKELQDAGKQLEEALSLEEKIKELKQEKLQLDEKTAFNGSLDTISDELKSLALRLLELRRGQANTEELYAIQNTVNQTKANLEQILAQFDSRKKKLEQELSDKLAEQEQFTAILGITPGFYEKSRRQLAALTLRHLEQLKRPDDDGIEALSREQKQIINEKQAARGFLLATSFGDFFRSTKLVSMDFDLVIADESENLPLPAFYFFAGTGIELILLSATRRNFAQTVRESANSYQYSTAGTLIDCREDALLTMSILDWREQNLTEDPLLRDTVLTNEQSFWDYFIADLNAAEEEIFIVSPFAYPNRLGKIIEHLQAAANRSVNVRLVISREPQGERVPCEEVKAQLAAHGFEVHALPNIHQKVAIIDRRISWEGSLNILSHSQTRESMRRLPGAQVAREIMHNLHLKLVENSQERPS